MYIPNSKIVFVNRCYCITIIFDTESVVLLCIYIRELTYHNAKRTVIKYFFSFEHDTGVWSLSYNIFFNFFFKPKFDMFHKLYLIKDLFLIVIKKHVELNFIQMCNENSGRCKYCIGFVSLIVFNVKCVNLVN